MRACNARIGMKVIHRYTKETGTITTIVPSARMLRVEHLRVRLDNGTSHVWYPDWWTPVREKKRKED